ncbi:MAG TPA: type IV secretory system conjugative DNA transfer family protein [Candidatus Micrarchaeia archaeon]|nr:type IV secretory system conjugative DNA transfer family protein [Candidatus Micrarchaeia archaeon]
MADPPLPAPPRVRRPHGDTPADQICRGWGFAGWACAARQVAVPILGPPRSGTSRGPIIPNVAAWLGAVLVTSTRRDVCEATVRCRRVGICWVFDPGPVSWRWEGRRPPRGR